MSSPLVEIGILERVANWLVHTALFEQAWAAVCVGLYNWWWSQQLCLFTVGAWTVFLFIECAYITMVCTRVMTNSTTYNLARRQNIPYAWAYMLFGQVVAISVASNLFYLAVLFASPPVSSKARSKNNNTVTAPFRLWFPVIISLVTVHYSPILAKTTYFLPNLLAMHGLIVLPLFFPGSNPAVTIIDPPKGRFSIPLAAFYTAIALSSALIRAPVVLRTLAKNSPFPTVTSALFATLHAHPAQSSIGYDVIWTSVSFLVWRAYTAPAVGPPGGIIRLVGKTFNVVASAAGIIVASVGVVGPADLAMGGVGDANLEDTTREKAE